MKTYTINRKGPLATIKGKVIIKQNSEIVTTEDGAQYELITESKVIAL